MDKAPMDDVRLGPALFSNPRSETGAPRPEEDERQLRSPAAIGAFLSTEDDFEMGQAFVDVFARAGGRIFGFLAGCILVAGLWVLWAAL